VEESEINQGLPGLGVQSSSTWLWWILARRRFQLFGRSSYTTRERACTLQIALPMPNPCSTRIPTETVFGGRLLWGIGGVLAGLILFDFGTADAQDVPAPPVETDTFTVREAVRHAVRHNRALQAARQAVPRAVADLQAAQSRRFPVVEGRADYRRLSENVDYSVDLPGLPSGSETVTFAPALLDRYTFQARIEQPLFSGFRTQRAVEAARHRTQAARSGAEAKEADVAYRVQAAYWRLYETKARRGAAAQAFRQIDRQLTDMRNRRAAGTVTESDVLRVEARRAALRLERMQAAHAVNQARLSLNEVMGRPGDAPVAIDDTVTLAPVPPDAATLVDQALQQHPQLARLRQQQQAFDAEVGQARAGWYPQVHLLGSYLYARPNERLFPFEDEFAGTWEAGITASWSLSTGGRTAARSERAEARRTQATYEREHARQQVAAEVRRQRLAVLQSREAVAAAAVAVNSARSAYASVRSRFQAGMVVTADLLDAERSLRQAQARLAEAQAAYATARAALDRALGATQ
jgi:outer membrane protein TolC